MRQELGFAPLPEKKSRGFSIDSYLEENQTTQEGGFTMSLSNSAWNPESEPEEEDEFDNMAYQISLVDHLFRPKQSKKVTFRTRLITRRRDLRMKKR